jgi:hypothetical protein
MGSRRRGQAGGGARHGGLRDHPPTIATASGLVPTGIGVPAVLVAVLIGVTVPLPSLPGAQRLAAPGFASWAAGLSPAAWQIRRAHRCSALSGHEQREAFRRITCRDACGMR